MSKSNINISEFEKRKVLKIILERSDIDMEAKNIVDLIIREKEKAKK